MNYKTIYTQLDQLQELIDQTAFCGINLRYNENDRIWVSYVVPGHKIYARTIKQAISETIDFIETERRQTRAYLEDGRKCKYSMKHWKK